MTSELSNAPPSPFNSGEININFQLLNGPFSQTCSSSIMLTLLPLWYIASLLSLFRFSSASCSTFPFCEAYPECSRECLGGRGIEKNNSDSFFHSYGTDMMQICSTGTNLRDHYDAVFDCIEKNCTHSSTDGQAVWNRLVDDCGAMGLTVNSSLKPAAYSAHSFSSSSLLSSSSPPSTSQPSLSSSTPQSSSPTTSPTTSPTVQLPTSSQSAVDDNISKHDLSTGAQIALGTVIPGLSCIAAFGAWHAVAKRKRRKQAGAPDQFELRRRPRSWSRLKAVLKAGIIIHRSDHLIHLPIFEFRLSISTLLQAILAYIS